MLLKLILWLFILLISTNSYSETLCGVNTGICAEINAEHQLEVNAEIKDADGDLISIDSSGNLKVTLGTAISSGVDSITVYPPTQSYTNITTDTGTQIKSAAGYLFSVVVNTAGASTTATIYDNTACSGTTIGIVSTGAQTFLNYGPGVYFSSGLCITTSNGTPDADVTVVWK